LNDIATMPFFHAIKELGHTVEVPEHNRDEYERGREASKRGDPVAALLEPLLTFGGGGTWEKMFHYFQFRRDEFVAHYHKRSNVKSTFSMMKRKFGDSLRSKTDVAMVNETLCKILCHNLVVLIHEMCELGIDPVFWPSVPDPL
jgi:transposase